MVCHVGVNMVKVFTMYDENLYTSPVEANKAWMGEGISVRSKTPLIDGNIA